MEEFKTRLAEAMKIRGIKAAELSRKTGISKGTISNYLTGRYKAAQTNTYVLAEALNVKEAWLMGYNVDYSRDDDTKPNMTPDEIVDSILNAKPMTDEELKYENVRDPEGEAIIDFRISIKEIDLIQKARALPADYQDLIAETINVFYKNIVDDKKED